MHERRPGQLRDPKNFRTIERAALLNGQISVALLRERFYERVSGTDGIPCRYNA